MLTRLAVVSILQYIQTSNPYVIYLKLVCLYVSYTLIYKKKREREKKRRIWSQSVIDMDSHLAKERAGNASSIRLTARLDSQTLPSMPQGSRCWVEPGAQCSGSAHSSALAPTAHMPGRGKVAETMVQLWK